MVLSHYDYIYGTQPPALRKLGESTCYWHFSTCGAESRSNAGRRCMKGSMRGYVGRVYPLRCRGSEETIGGREGFLEIVQEW